MKDQNILIPLTLDGRKVLAPKHKSVIINIDKLNIHVFVTGIGIPSVIDAICAIYPKQNVEIKKLVKTVHKLKTKERT